MPGANQFASRLGLGGHSYIQELGNDPQPTFAEQRAVVAACLDAGIQLFDTTYYQERVALGTILSSLGRRSEAQISAWNFFKTPGQESQLVPFTPYQPQHIDTMLAELQTDYLDILVIHVHDDRATLARELTLADEWLKQGKVRSIALGMVQRQHLEWLPDGHNVRYVFAPYNAFDRAAAPVFEYARQRRISPIAMSPFVRGWKLDAIADDRRSAADILLRWVATQPLVDRVIVSMRREEWVRTNLASLARGPLSAEELERLEGWVARVG